VCVLHKTECHYVPRLLVVAVIVGGAPESGLLHINVN
jgi:hypothetical protein